VTKKIYLNPIIAVLLFAVGMITFPIGIMKYDLSRIPGDMGDARFIYYILEHGHLFVTGHIKEYWDATFLYPTENVIAYSVNLIGSLPFYSIPRILGLDRETSYQVWFLCLFAANYWCCYFALKKWFNSPILAVVGAYIFAFGIFNVGQTTNAQVFVKFMLPLIFYWAFRFLKDHDSKYFLFLALGLVYQFYCGFYLGFFAVYGLIFLFLSFSVVFGLRKLINSLNQEHGWIKIAGISVFSLSLLIPLLLPYIEASEIVGDRSFDSVLPSIPKPVSYFFTWPGSVLWGSILYDHSAFGFEQWWEHWLFPGALSWLGVLLTPLVYMVRKRRNKSNRPTVFFTLAFFLTLIFCLNVNGHTLYHLPYQIPGFSSMRALSRIIHMEVFFFVLLLVFSAKELLYTKKFKWIIYLLPVLVIADHAFAINYHIRRIDKETARDSVEVIKRAIVNQIEPNKSIIAVFHNMDNPSHREIISHNISAMLAAQDLNLKIVNGYTGSYPEGYMAFFDHTDENTLQQWLARSGVAREQVQLITLDRVNSE